MLRLNELWSNEISVKKIKLSNVVYNNIKENFVCGTLFAEELGY